MSAEATLTELDLSDNAFGPNGMEGLTDLLKSSSCYRLRTLKLNNNGLGIHGGKVRHATLLIPWMGECVCECGNAVIRFYRSFHVYQHVTSFSNMRAHWLAERTNAVGFRTQNMFNV